ncbi:PPR domain-containing protein/PPR_2 domain-containing protein/DYW_deaminase domain-containing protein [Cephalotus follicularis]|uniref:PPR domain-containing protein/PPR_2 domain-containing protein/DYW_deaminase domain-containing protein n=1 Tax=Cephalotus follicularis TaxID=3775 RepID=A0A1Q3AVA7_CEPFO|nr:PPR domain-containing protein/PPR_2 domain-containing protein/DYW_deaminase domain-containing protein [Cephalotus follicularis]
MLPSLCSNTLKTNILHDFNTPFELKQVHAHLIKTNAPLSLLPLTRVGLVCALSSSFLYAQEIFDNLQKPDLFAWNSCLKTFAKSGNPFKAVLFFYQLREYDVLPDEFTCSFVLEACVNLVDVLNGRVIHGYVEKLGFRCNLFLLNMLVHLYALSGEIRDARLLFDTMSHRDVVTWNIMMTQLVKRGDIDRAYDLFSRMPERSVRSWTLMISGFVQCGKAKEAIYLFREMEELGVRPNEVTVVAVLAACADLGLLDLGRKVHEYSNQSGFRRNVKVYNTLIDMYVKCGCLEDAWRVFDEMEERTIVSWSAMIAGLAMHGQAEEALRLFSKMIEIGIRPNGVTLIGLLHACSHMGFIDEGRRFFANMTRDYGITPLVEHYGCMVDLYSRAGHLQEAHEFIKNMPIKPNGVVWGALLGGCKVHKNIELAEEAIGQLAVLDPLNDGYYVVLSNIYAEAERWEDVVRMRKMMRDRGVKKTRGWSSITIDGVVHEFVAGDETHPQAEEIFQMWENLLRQMKMKGYVPNTSVVLLDMEEQEKEKVLFRHSEKLALVFGLMNTSPGTPIRIMKNLRVCEDCHAAFKMISAIVNREIVVRDRNRFHRFKDGSCSCRNYW